MADRSLRADDREEEIRRYADMVYRLAFARMGNTSDAEDVFQEVFLRYLTAEDIDLWEQLRRLPEQHRTVLHLYYYEGLSTREMAALLGRREATVRSQLTRARQKLRDYLKEE